MRHFLKYIYNLEGTANVCEEVIGNTPVGT